MNSEGLDNIFKKGLSERNVDFNMDAWHKMEKMLPPEQPKKKIGWMRYALSVAGAFVVLIGGYFTFNSDSQPVTSQDSTPQQSATVKSSSTNNDFIDAAPDELDFVSNPNNNSTGNTSNLNEQHSAAHTTQNVPQMHYVSGNTVPTSNAVVPVEQTLVIDSKPQVEHVGFIKNAFTKITGIGELSESLLAANLTDDHTIVASLKQNKRPKAQQNELGIIGGANINASIGDGSSSYKASEFFGLSYTRYIKGGLGIKANVLYSNRNNINTSKLQSIKTYGFGSNIETKTLYTNSLYYLDVPIMLNYGIGNGNVMVGAQASYLVNGYHTLKTTNHSISGELSESETNEFGYLEGFNRFDVGLVLGYEHSVAPRWNVGARFNYGLIDVTNNAYFDSSSFDRNKQVRLYVTFSPFKF